MQKINILLLTSMLILAGCNDFKSWVATEFMADKLSDGVARLSAQHMSMILSELNPSFDSAEAIITPSSDPTQIGKGSVSWTIKDNIINHPSEVAIHTDCMGEEALWQGKVHIKKAVKTMYGRLTNNPQKPVIPEPGSLKFKVDAEASNLSIRFPSKEGHLKLEQARISFRAHPRLAQNETGMRLAPTPNTRFDKVNLTNLKGFLVKNGVKIPVSVDDANLKIQVGMGEEGDENSIRGDIILNKYKRSVPQDGGGLDPNYEREDFIKSYACKQSTPGVVSYQHVAIENKVAHGIGALTSALMAVLATELEENTECGMSSPLVIKNSTTQGLPGEHGELNSYIKKPCALKFKNYQTQANCFGQAKLISGDVSIKKAHKRVKGLVVATAHNFAESILDYEAELEKNSPEAINKRPKFVLPASSQPLAMSLNAKLENIILSDICVPSGLIKHPEHCLNKPKKSEDAVIYRAYDGYVEAKIKPLIALDRALGITQNFCAKKTPIGEMSLSIKNLQASIERQGLILKGLTAGHISLVRGALGERENELSGALKIGNELFEFNRIALEPSYDRALFLQSFMSCQELALVKNDEECRPEAGLAANMARLLVLNAGSLLKIASSKTVPQSLSSKYALDNSELIDNDKILKMPALLPHAIDLTDSDYALLSQNNIILEGQIISLSAHMLRRGERIHKPQEVLGFNVNILSHRWAEGLSTLIQDKKELIIRPTTPDSTSIALEAQIRNFTTHRISQSKKAEPSLTILDGYVNINATPLFARDKRIAQKEQQSYSIATPVVKFDRIIVEETALLFKGNHMTIPFYLERADIRAHNGRYLGAGNYIKAAISYRLISAEEKITALIEPHIIQEQALMLDYDQQRFDQSYADTEYMAELLKAY